MRVNVWIEGVGEKYCLRARSPHTNIFHCVDHGCLSDSLDRLLSEFEGYDIVMRPPRGYRLLERLYSLIRDYYGVRSPPPKFFSNNFISELSNRSYDGKEDPC